MLNFYLQLFLKHNILQLKFQSAYNDVNQAVKIIIMNNK